MPVKTYKTEADRRRFFARHTVKRGMMADPRICVNGKWLTAELDFQTKTVRVPRWAWLPGWTRHIPFLRREHTAVVLKQPPPSGARVIAVYQTPFGEE